ncbi:MAG TPA: DNA starvation/stationary phase protection protein Dps [Gammaproteobacteria bacterium]|nr:DNA starvation/stationary phase protection protein Dps [Gammaproteobacteria bacterium]
MPANKKSTNTATKELIDLLNQSLANTLDLKLQVKQAHWNVRGENFIALHQLFDEVAGAVEEYADMLAERVLQLGGIAKGTIQVVAENSSLKPYSTEIYKSAEHVTALTSSLRAVADSNRALIDASDSLGDKVTADLCTEITRGLDKWRWFVESNL